MRILLDTQVLLWAAGMPDRLPPLARTLIEEEANDLHYSAVSIWEVTLKLGRGREDLAVEPRLLRRALLENGYEELAVTGSHAAAVDLLPPIHHDAVDRLLVAQAQLEAITLITADEIVGRYPGPIRVI